MAFTSMYKLLCHIPESSCAMMLTRTLHQLIEFLCISVFCRELGVEKTIRM